MNRFAFIILTYLLLTNFLSATGQEVEKKAFYIDSTGKLFVSPNVPVKLFIGTKPDGSDAVPLRKENAKTGILYWNGHGPQLMTHLDLYKGRKIRFELFADGISPKTSIIPKNISVLELKEAIVIQGGSIIELAAIDENAGVEQIFFAINDNSFNEYNEPINLTDDGEYEIKVYSTDHLGNTEPGVYRKIIVDATPPITEISTKGDRYEDILSGRAAIILTPTDRFGVESTKIMIDSLGKWFEYKQPIQTSALAEGLHKLTWYSTDKAGNVEPHKSHTFFVDKTPPMVVEEIDGNSYMVGNREFSSGRSRLKIMAVDNKAGVKEIYYSLNNKQFLLYEKPVLLSDILGTVKLKTYAIDNVNNRSNSEANSQSFTMPTIDITGPNLDYRYIGKNITLRDTIWIGPATKIELIATDKEAGVNRIEYSLNRSENRQYLEPFVITENDFYTMEFTGYDNVDNLNAKAFSFAVDNQAPEIYWHFSVKPIERIKNDNEEIAVYPTNTMIYLGASDNITAKLSITYSINGSKFQEYSTPISNLKFGLNELIITASDELNNTTSITVKFFIK